ncbi:hypothetical protein BDP27DRAFT_1334147 [Rhodocollybia butyracea]|uniref:MINDY deubiquitinase domain-containing protein n=1 Tax=Rhodocollybia butyracea TaxID=206335 RepID=A0A9P5PK18_9AGAR|nr:hypothetical protein BDP27DRAFT_1334147 [Rhodocollybia butyracea]
MAELPQLTIAEPRPQQEPWPRAEREIHRVVSQQQSWIQASTDNYQNSISDVWYLKNIEFGEGESRKSYRIITQNFNGPCSLIAICNILILRGAIEIPAGRTSVSYEYLSQLVAEHLLMTCPDVDISAALEIMPLTQKGMDLNPLFTGAKSFRPQGLGGELKLFEQVGIDLVHGWLVDPASPEADAVSRTSDYDSAVMLIAEADHITKGRFVLDISEEVEMPQASSSRSPVFSNEDRAKIEDATTIRRFLDNTQSQLTYHGLFHLASTNPPGALMALFRNLHLSVLYKRSNASHDPSLYTLVTDQVFLNEPSIVWERIEDVDGGSSTFVDSWFTKSTPIGGDFAGRTAEEAVNAAEREMSEFYPSDPLDLALAQQLQAEENDRALGRTMQQMRQQKEREAQRQQAEEEKSQKKKKKDCIIM